MVDTLFCDRIAKDLSLGARSVQAVVALLDDGATIPFIARYRKEVTGNLDEVQITSVRDRAEQLRELDARREAILKSLQERNLLTDELKRKVTGAQTLTLLEDIYLPYRPKRRTRATIAKEKGLEPLSVSIMAQGPEDPSALAAQYISDEKGVKTAEEALAGARDIIAEQASEDETARARVRELFFTKGTFATKVLEGKEQEGAKFKDYFDWKEPVAKAPSHRVLAMRRGEKEGILTLRAEAPEDDAISILENIFVKADNACGRQVREAVADGYRRLLSLSMETEVRLETKRRADAEAIAVFARNLREILMAPPLGPKNILALDPGYRTGCKVCCLDRQGKLLEHGAIFPHEPQNMKAESAEYIKRLYKKYSIEVIVVGNGTAGRETEDFARDIGLPIPVVMVNESGASVYSASEVAREEFPDHDVTVRGAVSIGRRLMDPLAELVKIDPKSIGVGQYQHDVDQSGLKKSLDDVVVSCVNNVGVDVNTASKELLTYVSGLGPVLAKNLIAYRNENGRFNKRDELKKIPRLGPKAFEQCAGFLRIINGENPLDASAVHPESYKIVSSMAKDCGVTVSDLMKDPALRAKIDVRKYVTEEVGLPTLNDIMNELAKPGRDPREKFEIFTFADIQAIADVKPGMKVPGIVTNVTAFGAFVDIGVHQDGLIHISEMADNYVKDPNEVLKVRQQIKVTVIDVDLPRKRIALSLKTNPQIGPREERVKSSSAPSSRNMPPRGDKRQDNRQPPPSMAAAFQNFFNKKNG